MYVILSHNGDRKWSTDGNAFDTEQEAQDAAESLRTLNDEDEPDAEYVVCIAADTT